MTDITFEQGDKDALAFIDTVDIIKHLEDLGYQVIDKSEHNLKGVLEAVEHEYSELLRSHNHYATPKLQRSDEPLSELRRLIDDLYKEDEQPIEEEFSGDGEPVEVKNIERCSNLQCGANSFGQCASEVGSCFGYIEPKG
jgi:hypothetical protein